MIQYLIMILVWGLTILVKQTDAEIYKKLIEKIVIECVCIICIIQKICVIVVKELGIL